MNKYKLTNNTIEFNGKVLHQIKALIDFGIVQQGDLGGYIEKESNLSQEGNAWVFDNAKVFGNAEVFDNAGVFGNAEVFDNAMATTRVLSFNFLTYNITLTDNHIQIGCKQFTYEVALKLSKKDCGKLFSSEEFQKMWQHKKLLLELIKIKRPDLFKKEGK